MSDSEKIVKFLNKIKEQIEQQLPNTKVIVLTEDESIHQQLAKRHAVIAAHNITQMYLHLFQRGDIKQIRDVGNNFLHLIKAHHRAVIKTIKEERETKNDNN